jgi:hypothetical protein
MPFSLEKLHVWTEPRTLPGSRFIHKLRFFSENPHSLQTMRSGGIHEILVFCTYKRKSPFFWASNTTALHQQRRSLLLARNPCGTVTLLVINDD